MSRRGIVAGALVSVAVIAGCGGSDPKPFTALPAPTTEPDAGGPPSPPASGEADACVIPATPWITRDFDGDGVVGAWLIGCGKEQQVSTGLSDLTDCDDTDPTRAAKGFRDADGDGYTVGDAECFTTVPPGYLPQASTWRDCDDSSADVQVDAWGDADGDGHGDISHHHCVKAVPMGSAYPAGLAGYADDCNDADPSIHPGADELWDDNVDSDCDGSKSPLWCDIAKQRCGCELLGATGVPVIASCASADLFVAAQVTCRSCSSYTALVVGNQGAVPVAGDVTVVTSDGKRIRVEGTLGPGAVSYPVIVPAGVTSVRIDSVAIQCDTGNDELALHVVPTQCYL